MGQEREEFADLRNAVTFLQVIGLGHVCSVELGRSGWKERKECRRAERERRDEREFDLRRSTRDVEQIRFEKQIKGQKCRRGGARTSRSIV